MRYSVYAMGSLAVTIASSAYAVPAEFAALEQAHVETMDLTFLGKSLGDVQVRLSPDTIEFVQPSQVLSRLAVAEKRRAEVLAWLSRPLPRNDALSCGNAALVKENCGSLDTRQAGVIYDDAESTLQLFIATDALLFEANNSQKQTRFLTPSAETRSGFVHSQSISAVDASGDGPQSRSVSISGTGALGISDSSFAAIRWNANQSENNQSHYGDSAVTDLYYRHDLDPRHYVQGGRMESQDLYGALGGSQSFTFLPIPIINGVRAGTGRAYLNPGADFTATALPVVLQSRSRIEAYRGAQLLQTFSLPAGAHSLDVGRFPDGSYPVTLRVFDGSQLVSEQTLPFAKHSGINSADGTALDWFIQAGTMSAQDVVSAFNPAAGDKRQGSPVFQAGIRTPVRDWPLTAGLGISGDSSARYAEGIAIWDGDALWGKLNAQVSLFAGSNGVSSRSENINWMEETTGLGLSVYHTRTDTRDCASVSSPMYATSGCGNSITATASLTTGPWQWSASYSHATNSVDTSRDFYSNLNQPGRIPGWDNEQRGDQTRTAQVSVSRSFNLSGVNLTANLGLTSEQSRNDKAREGVYLTVNATWLHSNDTGNTGRSASTNVNVNYQGGNLGASQTSLSHNESWSEGSQRSLGADASVSDDGSKSASLNGRYEGQYGDLDASLSVNTGSNDGRSLTLNYDSSFSISSAAGFAFGPAAESTTTPPAAVILQLPAVGDEDALLLQSRSQGSFDVSVDRTISLPVDGYSVADYQLEDASESTAGNVSLNRGRTFEGFLLPGHVVLNRAEANVSYTYIGRLMLDGAPLAGAVVLGKDSAISEDNGGFTLQMGNREARELYAYRQDKGAIKCVISQHKNRADVVFVAGLTCQKVPVESLPEAIRQTIEALHTEAIAVPARQEQDGGAMATTGETL